MTNIVMLVRNRLHLTAQALASLIENTDPHYNLVVVDDGSDDFRVRQLLDQGYMPAHMSVLHVNNSSHTLSQLKNLGVYWSEQRWGRGDWLCLCDNDIYFKPNWLERMIHIAQATGTEFSLWGGQAHPFHKSIAEGIKIHEFDCLAGTHWFMPWETWDLYGPLDRTTAPGVCQSEDYAFTQRLRARGGRIGVVVPHVVIDTSLTQTDGSPCPGAAEKAVRREPGVLYL